MTVLSPEKAPYRVRAVKDELPMTTLVEAAEARLAEFAPDYELVEIVRTKYPDRCYVASRKGDTYMTHAMFLGESGYGRKREYVSSLEWGRYGLTRRTYAANLHGRTK